MEDIKVSKDVKELLELYDEFDFNNESEFIEASVITYVMTQQKKGGTSNEELIQKVTERSSIPLSVIDSDIDYDSSKGDDSTRLSDMVVVDEE